MNGKWMRNYGAMGDEKLLDCLRDFDRGWGPAINRVENEFGDVKENAMKCYAVAAQKGLRKSGETSTILDGLEVRECAECNQQRPHAADDYICVNCRAA